MNKQRILFLFKSTDNNKQEPFNSYTNAFFVKLIKYINAKPTCFFLNIFEMIGILVIEIYWIRKKRE